MPRCAALRSGWRAAWTWTPGLAWTGRLSQPGRGQLRSQPITSRTCEFWMWRGTPRASATVSGGLSSWRAPSSTSGTR
eukprot:7764102-Alexandrium_andersonii.AAC.1